MTSKTKSYLANQSDLWEWIRASLRARMVSLNKTVFMLSNSNSKTPWASANPIATTTASPKAQAVLSNTSTLIHSSSSCKTSLWLLNLNSRCFKSSQSQYKDKILCPLNSANSSNSSFSNSSSTRYKMQRNRSLSLNKYFKLLRILKLRWAQVAIIVS